MNTLADIIHKAIELRGMSIFDNANIFIGIIDDLAPELTKERNICHRVINSETLALLKAIEIVDASQRNKAIARCRYYICEEQGINEEWYGIIISAFAQALDWVVVTAELEDNISEPLRRDNEVMTSKGVGSPNISSVDKRVDKGFGKISNLNQDRKQMSKIYGKVIATDNYTVALMNDGTVLCAGTEKYGQFDTNSWKDIIAVSVGKGWYHTVGLKSDGTVVAVGNNSDGQCDVLDWNNIISVCAGGKYTIGLKSDGTVIATGCNNAGECDVLDWENIVCVSAYNHTVGLKLDGTVIAVGDNKEGRCDVSNWSNIIAISAGWYHTVGLKADGTVIAVGSNKMGQCKVSKWTDIVAIYAGTYCTIGIKSDGTVVATGYNSFEQLNVSGWTNIVAVCAGRSHTIGLKKDGTLVVAGRNDAGQCNVEGWNLFENLGISHILGGKEQLQKETFKNQEMVLPKIDDKKYLQKFKQSTIDEFIKREYTKRQLLCMYKSILYIDDSEITNNVMLVNKDFNVLVLGKKVKKIADEVFKGCEKLEYIYVLGGNDLHIGRRSFSECKNLKVVIMNHVPDEDENSQSILKSFFDKKETYFSNDAFEGCGYIEWFIAKVVRKNQKYLMQYCKANKFGYYTIVGPLDGLDVKDDNFVPMWNLLRIEFQEH